MHYRLGCLSCDVADISELAHCGATGRLLSVSGIAVRVVRLSCGANRGDDPLSPHNLVDLHKIGADKRKNLFLFRPFSPSTTRCLCNPLSTLIHINSNHVCPTRVGDNSIVVVGWVLNSNLTLAC